MNQVFWSMDRLIDCIWKEGDIRYTHLEGYRPLRLDRVTDLLLN